MTGPTCCCCDYPKWDEYTYTPDKSKEGAPIDDDQSTVIFKFFLLFSAGVVVFSGFQLLHHVFDVLSGGPVFRGLENAKIAHLSSLGNETIDEGTPLSNCEKAKHIALECILRISIIVATPLFIVAKLFAAFIGFIAPYHGRAIFSRIERLYYVPPVDKYAPAIGLEQIQFNAPLCSQLKPTRSSIGIVKVNCMTGAALA